MKARVQEIEAEIQASRARLDDTIDRIQDRFNLSGIVDELVGAVRESDAGPVLDDVLGVVRRNPLPVLLIAAGAGWLAYRLSQERATAPRLPGPSEAEGIPVLNTGNIRVYDPDQSPRHPAQDSLETRREASARA